MYRRAKGFSANPALSDQEPIEMQGSVCCSSPQALAGRPCPDLILFDTEVKYCGIVAFLKPQRRRICLSLREDKARILAFSLSPKTKTTQACRGACSKRSYITTDCCCNQFNPVSAAESSRNGTDLAHQEKCCPPTDACHQAYDEVRTAIAFN